MTEMKLGVLLVGLSGATANTFAVSVACAHTDAGNRISGAISDNPKFEHLGLVKFENIVVSGWDFTEETAFTAAKRHGVIPQEVFQNSQNRLGMTPLPAIASAQDPVLLQEASQGRELSDYFSSVDALEGDIDRFKVANSLQHCVVVNLASPQKQFPDALLNVATEHDLRNIVRQIGRNRVPSSLCYAHAAISSGCGFIDFTTSQSLQIPFLQRLSKENSVPIAGRDGSTGQTYLKLGLARLLGLRGLRIDGWYSANILGNQDGFVLSQSGFDEVKKYDKTEGLNNLASLTDENHIVDITYYKPRGDNKEAWDSVDFSGWYGLPMQMKINWIGRDSILAGPLLLDLCRFIGYEVSKGRSGLQNHLNFYFKSPLVRKESSPYEEYLALIERYDQELGD